MRHDIHEARKIRDAETRDPGIIRRALDEQLNQGKEPTKAALRRAISDRAGHRTYRSDADAGE